MFNRVNDDNEKGLDFFFKITTGYIIYLCHINCIKSGESSIFFIVS